MSLTYIIVIDDTVKYVGIWAQDRYETRLIDKTIVTEACVVVASKLTKARIDCRFFNFNGAMRWSGESYYIENGTITNDKDTSISGQFDDEGIISWRQNGIDLTTWRRIVENGE